ncbi:hypothetical protein BX600DRAFT_473243 [Xylariales sp. PMI_506]|nr:hypothetical protein BX600DRAFT_473243 [Xylariales sp. PMI_506]
MTCWTPTNCTQAKLPRATDGRPSLHFGNNQFSLFCRAPDGPGYLEDYLLTDDAPISLRVTSFEDATLVAVCWPHSMMDTMGLRELVKAWCRVLAGHDDIPPLVGAQEDVMEPIIKGEGEDGEPNVLAPRLLQGWKFAWLALGILWQIIQRPSVGTRTIFLPAPMVSSMHQQALDDLKDGSFVSEGDVICSWITRLIVSVHEYRSRVSLLNVVDIRGRLSILKKDSVYVQNLISSAYSYLEGNRILKEPLSCTAVEVRRSLFEQATESQIKAHKRGFIGEMPLHINPSGMFVIVSSWTKANFVNVVDFSPALIRLGEQGDNRLNPPGSMLYHLTSITKMPPFQRNSAVVRGKDHVGNYWMNLYLAESLFDKVECLLQKI